MVIERIKSGIYKGKEIDGEWFVEKSELSNDFGGSGSRSSSILALKNDYKISIFISLLVSFVGWIAVIGGVILSFILIKEGGMALLGLSSAITVTLVCLLLVIGGQASRAVMDNSNYSKHMLEIMKQG